jgi:hypothetical protein
MKFGIWLHMTAWLTMRLDIRLLNVDNLHSDNLEFAFHPLSFCLLTVSSQQSESDLPCKWDARCHISLLLGELCPAFLQPNPTPVWFDSTHSFSAVSQSVSLSPLSPTVYDLLMRTYFRKSVSGSAGVWRKIESVPRARFFVKFFGKIRYSRRRIMKRLHYKLCSITYFPLLCNHAEDYLLKVRCLNRECE